MADHETPRFKRGWDMPMQLGIGRAHGADLELPGELEPMCRIVGMDAHAFKDGGVRSMAQRPGSIRRPPELEIVVEATEEARLGNRLQGHQWRLDHGLAIQHHPQGANPLASGHRRQ